MDAQPAEPAPSSEQEPPDPPAAPPPLVRYYRIDFQRCVIQRGRRASRPAPLEKP